MRDKLVSMIFNGILRLRWAYFHIHPGYVKFFVETEPWFFHAKTNSMHCDMRLK